MVRPVTRGIVLVLILLGGWSIHAAGPAGAHAVLESSTPPDQSVLESSPERVRLSFNEPVTLVTGGLRVFDSNGERVDRGLPSHGDEPSQVTVALQPDLPSGSYVVTWRVISADAHPVHGGFVFSVERSEDVVGLDALLDGSSAPVEEAAGAALRGIGYLGGFLVVGAALFVAFVRRDDVVERLLVRTAGVIAAITVVAQVLALPVNAALATGEGPGSLFEEGVLGEMLGQGVGVTMAGVAAAVILGVVALARTGSTRRWTAGGSLVAVTGAFVASGHTRTAEPVWLVSLVDAVHVAAAAVWVGGIAVLLWSLRQRRRARPDASDADATAPDAAADPVVAADEVVRFSRLATASIVAVAVAGVVLAYVEVRSLRGLFETTYGRLVLAKVALLAVLAALGAFNHFRLVPALVARPDRPARWRYLHRTLAGEALALLAVIGFTAVLVTTVPARAALLSQEIFSVSAQLGSGATAGSANLVIDPARTGRSVLHLYLLDEHGRQQDPAHPVEVELVQPELEIGPLHKELDRAGPGHYLVSGTLFTVPGEWTVTVRVRVDDFTEHSAVLTVEVRR